MPPLDEEKHHGKACDQENRNTGAVQKSQIRLVNMEARKAKAKPNSQSARVPAIFII
jgi:hypothetical protein